MDDLLNSDDHREVLIAFLCNLSAEDGIALGKVLGLKESTMSDMPDDLVDAWLKMKDDVFVASGEPTCNSLVTALKKINQESLADGIIKSGGIPQLTTTTTSVSSVKSTSSGANIISGADIGDVLPNDTGAVDNAFQVTSNDERIEDDFWPFTNKSKNKVVTVRQDSASKDSNLLDTDRIQDDARLPFKSKERVYKQAKDRGTYKAQLRLHDNDDEITVINPEQSDGQLHSRLGFYPMKAKRHGVALIINNKEFRSDEHKLRRGTDRDEQNLSETWQFLGYHVVILRDYTRDHMAQMFEKIDDLLENAKDVANDSFVCCILSHGREGEVFGSDSRPLEYTRIQRFLAKSEILRSRPKMLFIQACQGTSPGTPAMKDHLKEIDSDDDRISEYTDFYLSYASVDGDRSYRDIFTGTWFISELCQTLCELSMVMDLDELQKVVNHRVVTKYEHLGNKQQPRGVDQLRKKVFFFHESKVANN